MIFVGIDVIVVGIVGTVDIDAIDVGNVGCHNRYYWRDHGEEQRACISQPGIQDATKRLYYCSGGAHFCPSSVILDFAILYFARETTRHCRPAKFNIWKLCISRGT